MNLLCSYFAGYIDGDGCFFISQTKNKFRANIIVTSTSREALERLESFFGGKTRKNWMNNIFHKPQYSWHLSTNSAAKAINKIQGFLVERKQESIIFSDFITTKQRHFKAHLIQTMRNYRKEFKMISREVFDDIKNTRYIGDFTEENAAYLAGFIDAECSLGISKYKPKNGPNFTYKIVLQCTNTSPHIFYWLKKKIGGNVSFIQRNKKNKNHRNQIIWNTSGKNLYGVLKKILPFIKSKKPVCECLIELHETNLKNGGARHTEAFRSLYEKVLSKREEIVSKVHHLNSKGI